MRSFFKSHPKTQWALILIACFVSGIILLSMLTDWNAMRAPLARVISAKTGRESSIGGNLRVHLWSLNPSADIEGLRINNPPWAAHAVMFTAKRVSVSVSLGRLLRAQLVLPKLELASPEVNLERDLQGRASWDFANTGAATPVPNTKPTKLPSVRLLLIEDGKIDISDLLEKLKLTGSVVATEKTVETTAHAFLLRAAGSLNAKPFKLEFNGGPLINLSPDHPYDFDMDITASTIHASAAVTISKPFDLGEFTAKLHLSGKDLADAYYLTGLALPNTADYDLTATVHRSGARFELDDFKGRIGKSDIEGKIGVDSSKKRLALKAQLLSRNLNFADLAPTLGAAPAAPTLTNQKPAAKAQKTEKLLPDADLQLRRVRGMDADVSFRAASVTAPKLPLKAVSFHLLLLNGELKIDPLSFEFDQGQFGGSVQIDARHDIPETFIDMHTDKVDLKEFKSAKATDAPLSGLLQGRLKIHGFGSSIHKLASTADGGLSLAIPHGEISDTLAELTGINVLRALGLLFAKNSAKAEIRCGVIDLQANNGTLQAKTLFIDTTNVLITGRGRAQLSNEDLDFSFQGDPKRLRLIRLRAPVSLGGTLADPTIGIKPEKLLAQAGAATALGVLLTPVAAVLAFIDPGLAKDKNCAAMLEQESADLAASATQLSQPGALTSAPEAKPRSH
ncbi:MAG: AsmA family protein [Steroidobacteraceae bacterium]